MIRFRDLALYGVPRDDVRLLPQQYERVTDAYHALNTALNLSRPYVWGSMADYPNATGLLTRGASTPIVEDYSGPYVRNRLRITNGVIREGYP